MNNYVLFDYVTLGVCVVDKEYKIIFWNKRLEEWTGKKKDEVLQHSLDWVFPGFKDPAYKMRINHIFSGGPPVILSSQLHPNLFLGETSTGKKAIQRATISALPIGNNEYHALFSIEDVTDLSDRIKNYKKMRDVARAVAEEKELLLSESHHRIKNNLTMVSSLIELKAGTSKEPAKLRELKNQIDSISLVHEELYQKKNFNSTSFQSYLNRLIQSFYSFMGKRTIHFKTNIEDASLPPALLVPLGLIINEVFTNGLKHGYEEDQEAAFSVELVKDTVNVQYALSIENDGKPIPETVSTNNPKTLGLKLISSLTEQIEGELEIEKSSFPRIIIRFPAPSS